jgi:hypothetical protein
MWNWVSNCHKKNWMSSAKRKWWFEQILMALEYMSHSVPLELGWNMFSWCCLNDKTPAEHMPTVNKAITHWNPIGYSVKAAQHANTPAKRIRKRIKGRWIKFSSWELAHRLRLYIRWNREPFVIRKEYPSVQACNRFGWVLVACTTSMMIHKYKTKECKMSLYRAWIYINLCSLQLFSLIQTSGSQMLKSTPCPLYLLISARLQQLAVHVPIS